MPDHAAMFWYCKMIDDRVNAQFAIHNLCWSDALVVSYGLFYRSRSTAEFASHVAVKMLVIFQLANISLAGGVTFAWLANDQYIYCPTGPTIIVCLMANGIARSFSTIYQGVIDTVMECYCEDKERNDGSYMRPYYMTDGLKQLLLKDLQDGNGEDMQEEQPTPGGVDDVEDQTTRYQYGHQHQQRDRDKLEEVEELEMYYKRASDRN